MRNIQVYSILRIKEKKVNGGGINEHSVLWHFSFHWKDNTLSQSTPKYPNANQPSLKENS